MAEYTVASFETYSGNAVAAQPGAKAIVVHEEITNLHPSMAPLRAILDSIQIDTTIPEWPIDKYALARTQAALSVESGTRARAENAEAVIVAAVTPQKLCNQTTIYHEGFRVSRTARGQRIHGISNVVDYAIDQSMHSVANDSEMFFHFGTGNTTGSATVTPSMLGLIPWAAWSGLERRHGTQSPFTSVTLPFSNVRQINGDFYTSFFNAGGATLSREVLYNEILGPWHAIGGEVEGSFMLVPNALMTLVADFHMSSKGQINDRVIPARDQALVDTIVSIITPGMGEFFVMVDRYLDIEGQAVTIDNRPDVDGTGVGGAIGNGTINSAGVGTVTMPYNETVLMLMPSLVKIGTYHPITYQPLSTGGDYLRGMVVGEETVIPYHPIALTGATNLRP